MSIIYATRMNELGTGRSDSSHLRLTFSLILFFCIFNLLLILLNSLLSASSLTRKLEQTMG